MKKTTITPSVEQIINDAMAVHGQGGPLTDADLGKIRAFNKRREAARHVTVATDPTGNREMNLRPPNGSNVHAWHVGLMTALGTTSPDFATRMLEQLTAALGGPDGLPPQRDINGILASIAGIAPENEAEAMLATQMVATQAAVMKLMQQMGQAAHIEQRDSAGNLAVKMMRTFTAQMETLKRYRSKGEQKMVVQHQHVTVTAENAAVQVNAPADSGAAAKAGGGVTNAEEQPHDPRQIAFAPGTPLWGTHAERDTLPMPRRRG